MKFIVLATFLLAFTLTHTEEDDFNVFDLGCFTEAAITRAECNKKTATTTGMECCFISGYQDGQTKSTCSAVKKNETSLKKFYDFIKESKVSSISILCASSYVKIATIVFTSLFFLF